MYKRCKAAANCPLLLRFQQTWKASAPVGEYEIALCYCCSIPFRSADVTDLCCRLLRRVTELSSKWLQVDGNATRQQESKAWTPS